MKINRSHIIAVLSLSVAVGTSFATYQFYVKERLKVLGEREKLKEDLEGRLTTIVETFDQTDPTTMITYWQRATLPWEETVAKRATFYNLGDTVLEAKVPDTQEPKFYYEDKYPELFDRLRQSAFENKTKLRIAFGVQDPGAYVGQAPPAEEVEENIVRIEFYSSVAQLLIEHDAIDINEINIWPIRHDKKKLHNGEIEYRTTGLNFTMTMEKFARFLDFLSKEGRFFSVDSFWIHNKQLRNRNAPMQIQMVLSQAIYNPRVAGSGSGGVAAGSAPQLNVAQAFETGGFGGGGFSTGFGGGDVGALEKPKGFFGKLLDLIPFL